MNVDASNNNRACSINVQFKDKLLRRVTDTERKTVVLVGKEGKKMSLEIFYPGGDSFSQNGPLIIQHLFAMHTDKLGRDMTLVDLIGKRIFSDINQLNLIDATESSGFKFYPTPESWKTIADELFTQAVAEEGFKIK